ncbi:Protease 1 precursor [compost metagenome]
MKRILLSLSLLTLTLQANSQTQIVNSDFEQWENLTTDNIEPLNWNSFKTASGTWNSQGAKQVDRSSVKRPGSLGNYSARIWTRRIYVPFIVDVNANGNLTLGQIEMGSTTATDPANYNYTKQSDANFSETFTDTPDSMVVWVKYKPVNPGAGNTGKISCVIHKSLASGNFKDPNDVSGSNVVAKAIDAINYNGGNWQRISLPFTYTGNTGPGFIITTLTSCYTPGGGDYGDTLLIDDLQLVYVPKASFTASGASVCAGSSLNFTSTSTNYPTSYSWNFGDGTPVSTTQNPAHQFATAGTYNVTLTVTNQWGSTTSLATTITVNALPNASLSYAQTAYCPVDADPVPTATNSGVFTSTAGIVINSSTGAIDLSASTPGTYTVTNTYTGTCTNTGTTSITINPPANASFSYPSNTICVGGANETPSVTDPGTFSALPSGLVFANTTTGEINVAGSTPGTYAITYNATGTVACPTSGSSSTVNITITSSPDATFTYTQTAYCVDATDPAPVFGVGANGGVFSSTTGLNINSNSGVIDLSASTAGTYTVTNTIAASGACPTVSGTYNVTVNALPNVTLAALTDVCIYHNAFTLTGGTPVGGTYTGTGVNAGSFNPATAGLGTKTITYSYTDANNCSNTATNTILVDECLGLEDNAFSAVSVYPNPTDGKLTLSGLSEETAFKVISVSGQVVLNGNVSNTADTIDLSVFENGIYLIQLTQGQAIQTIRIIKK